MKHTPVTTSIMAAIVLLAGVAAAAVTSDYFEYGPTNGTLVGLTTANTAGWGANGWSGSANPKYRLNNVVFFSKHGEANSYVNTNVGGRLRGAATAGTVTRSFASALGGTVWVSIAVTSTRWNATLDSQYSRILINNIANDFFGVGSLGFNDRIHWRVDENGVAVSNYFVAHGFTTGLGGCLVVARLRTNYSGTYDDIALWVFTNNCDKLATRNVAGLGDALYQSSNAHDIWGDSISSLGIAIKSANDTDRDHWVGSLRISSGTMSDDEHVYEILTGVPVPEPGAVMLGLAGLLGLVRRSRR